jgi:tRNA A-37 threonylcarbamoyl transferase component Bud32
MNKIQEVQDLYFGDGCNDCDGCDDCDDDDGDADTGSYCGHGGSAREKSTNHDTVKFINQGTYGCVFRPAINCKGNLLKPNFITKIQSEKANSDKETKIGYKIKKIKGYSKYFAPILKTCNISLANIKNDEIKKCDFIDNHTTKIISNKMKYVGDKTLLDYFIHILEEKLVNNTYLRISNSSNVQKCIEAIFDCYLHLLEGIELLEENNIVHYDLKENNIMFDETQDYPIIIDFGLSFETSNLHNSNHQLYKKLDEAFYVYAPDYKTWCFEIHLICYIIHYIKENELEDTISISFLNEGIDDIFRENLIFTHFRPLVNSNLEGHNETYAQSMKNFIKQYSDSNLSYRELIDKLLTFSYSWDNYSLAVIFLYSIYELKLDETYIMTKLVSLLKQIVFSTPDTRIGIKDTFDKVSDIYDEL